MIDDAPVSSSLLVKVAVWPVIHGRGNIWQICTCRYSLVVCNEHTEHHRQAGGGGSLKPRWRGALFSRKAAGGGPLLALALSTTSNWLALTRQL